MMAVAAGPASRDVLLIATHNDLAYKILGRKKARDTDIERLRAGGRESVCSVMTTSSARGVGPRWEAAESRLGVRRPAARRRSLRPRQP